MQHKNVVICLKKAKNMQVLKDTTLFNENQSNL